MEGLITQLKDLRYVVEEVAANIKSRISSYKDLDDLEAFEKSDFIEKPICNKIRKLLEIEQKIDVNTPYSGKKIEEILSDIQDVQLYINVHYYQWLQFF